MRQTIVFILAIIGFSAFGQEDTTSRMLDDVEILSKRTGFKKVGLYDEVPAEDYNIRGFTQLSIFENDLTDEFWTSKDVRCVSSKLIQDDVQSFLKLDWNKDLDGCDWVGLGFGWDGWSGKDIGYVVDTLAIELQVRSTDKPFTNLPWAFAIEDYSGQQAWLGYNRSFLQSKEISKEWTKVQIPLSLFPFTEQDVDLTNIKQLLIQVFAEGTVEIKKVHLVPFSKKLKKDVTALQCMKSKSIDGSLNDWTSDFTPIEGGHAFNVTYTQDSLFFAFNIKDETPRENSHEKGDLWQGDAIEIAYSTNVTANPKRKFLLLSDQHVGINCGQSTYSWDWKESKIEERIITRFAESQNGYQVEVAIPFAELYNLKLTPGINLDFEVAVDLNEGETRKVQNRWNSTFSEGFNTSPTKWGVLLLR